MAVYRCSVCGYVYDEEKEGRPISELDVCPVCGQPISKLVRTDEKNGEKKPAVPTPAPTQTVTYKGSLAYPSEFAREDPDARYMEEIHEMAVSGKTVSAAMGTRTACPGWDEILLLGAQLSPLPKDDGCRVSTETVIGKHAKKPMRLASPVYISHMSFGALSREAKIALAKGAAAAGTATCSGEGGILPEEREAAFRYIFEYVPNKYSVTDENLRSSDAIEIKIGQGTKPGMGGHLPGSKVTPEIAAIRGKKVGEDIQSPSKFAEINSKEDLRRRHAARALGRQTDRNKDRGGQDRSGS